MAKIMSIPPSQIWSMGIIIGPFIKKALAHAHGEMDEQAIYEKVAQGMMEAWLVSDDTGGPQAALITELITHPCRKVVRIVLCGGDHLDKWMGDFLDVMDNYARRWKADGIEVVGRKGWERVLKSRGYHYAYTALMREVT